jgi:hypothetical protein
MLPRGLLLRIMLMTVSLCGCSAREHAPSPQADRPAASATPPVSTSITLPLASPPRDGDRPAQRLYSLRRHVWIREQPSTSAPWIGYLGLGGSVPTRGAPVPGAGCRAFQPIEPRGFVCLDDKATLDLDAAARRAVAHLAPRTGEAFLHDYGEARQAPRYDFIPTPAQQRSREFGLDRHLRLVADIRDRRAPSVLPPLLLGVDVQAAGKQAPSWLADLPNVHEYRVTAAAGSTVSFVDSFDAEGRTWLITGDGALIPKDKVAPFPRSSFHGVELDRGVVLPIAFARERARPLRVLHDNAVVPAGQSVERLAWIGLTGKQITVQGRRYLETREPPWLIDPDDFVVVRPSPVTPWGDSVDAPHAASERRWPMIASPPPRGPRATWIEASVHEGWLIAYEGTRPVYATLAASGRGEPLGSTGFVQTSTATGVFSIQGKYWTETMDIGAAVHFDVPYTMPYHNSYAIHAAYWHDRWGEKVSLGCLNLSPLDARWLFLWAEPRIPEGWHGMTTRGSGGGATVVIVHA